MPTSSSRRAASASRTPSRTLGAPGLPAQHEAAGATLATETQAHASDVAVAPTLSARKPRLQALLASKKLVVGPEDGEGAPVQAPPGVPQAAPLAATAMAAADSVAAGLAAAASAHSTSTLVTIARIKPNRSATGLQVTIEPPAVPGGKTTLNLTATDDGSGAAGSAHGAPASKRAMLTTTHSYAFDGVLGPSSTQQDVAALLLPLLDDLLEGVNVATFCYGQTGAGKTHTLIGDAGSETGRGFFYRACDALFSRLASYAAEGWAHTCDLELYENYMDAVSDLGPAATGERVSVSTIGEETRVNNLSRVAVDSTGAAHEALSHALRRRRTAATKMNDTSSRSHFFTVLCVRGRRVEDKDTGAAVPPAEAAAALAAAAAAPGSSRLLVRDRVSRLMIVDLAGSERLSQTGATGQQQREAGVINRSLMGLRLVISQLEAGAGFISYRSSVLNQLVRPCLDARSRVAIIVNVNPTLPNLTTTLETLNFAAKMTKTVRPAAGAARNETVTLTEAAPEEEEDEDALDISDLSEGEPEAAAEAAVGATQEEEHGAAEAGSTSSLSSAPSVRISTAGLQHTETNEAVAAAKAEAARAARRRTFAAGKAATTALAGLEAGVAAVSGPSTATAQRAARYLGAAASRARLLLGLVEQVRALDWAATAAATVSGAEAGKAAAGAAAATASASPSRTARHHKNSTAAAAALYHAALSRIEERVARQHAEASALERLSSGGGGAGEALSGHKRPRAYSSTGSVGSSVSDDFLGLSPASHDAADDEEAPASAAPSKRPRLSSFVTSEEDGGAAAAASPVPVLGVLPSASSSEEGCDAFEDAASVRTSENARASMQSAGGAAASSGSASSGSAASSSLGASAALASGLRSSASLGSTLSRLSGTDYVSRVQALREQAAAVAEVAAEMRAAEAAIMLAARLAAEGEAEAAAAVEGDKASLAAAARESAASLALATAQRDQATALARSLATQVSASLDPAALLSIQKLVAELVAERDALREAVTAAVKAGKMPEPVLPAAARASIAAAEAAAAQMPADAKEGTSSSVMQDEEEAALCFCEPGRAQGDAAAASGEGSSATSARPGSLTAAAAPLPRRKLTSFIVTSTQAASGMALPVRPAAPPPLPPSLLALGVPPAATAEVTPAPAAEAATERRSLLEAAPLQEVAHEQEEEEEADGDDAMTGVKQHEVEEGEAAAAAPSAAPAEDVNDDEEMTGPAPVPVASPAPVMLAAALPVETAAAPLAVSSPLPTPASAAVPAPALAIPVAAPPAPLPAPAAGLRPLGLSSMGNLPIRRTGLGALIKTVSVAAPAPPAPAPAAAK